MYDAIPAWRLLRSAAYRWADQALGREVSSVVSVELDLHVHAGGEVELHQCINGLFGGFDDVEHALVRAISYWSRASLLTCGEISTV